MHLDSSPGITPGPSQITGKFHASPDYSIQMKLKWLLESNLADLLSLVSSQPLTCSSVRSVNRVGPLGVIPNDPSLLLPISHTPLPPASSLANFTSFQSILMSSPQSPASKTFLTLFLASSTLSSSLCSSNDSEEVTEPLTPWGTGVHQPPAEQHLPCLCFSSPHTLQSSPSSRLRKGGRKAP